MPVPKIWKCHLLTSSSGLKLLYSSGEFLFWLPNRMRTATIPDRRTHTSTNTFYTSKKSANSLLFETKLNLHNHIYLLLTRLTFRATQTGGQTFWSIDSEKAMQGTMLNRWIKQHMYPKRHQILSLLTHQNCPALKRNSWTSEKFKNKINNGTH